MTVTVLDQQVTSEYKNAFLSSIFYSTNLFRTFYSPSPNFLRQNM